MTGKTEEFDRMQRKQLEQLVEEGNGLLVPEDARETFRKTVEMSQDYFVKTGPFYIVKFTDPDGESMKLAAYRENSIGKSYELTDEVIRDCLPGRARTISHEMCDSELMIPRKIIDETEKLLRQATENPYHGRVFSEIDRLTSGSLAEKLSSEYESFANQINMSQQPQNYDKLKNLIILAKWKTLDIRDATEKGDSVYEVFEQIRECEKNILG